MGSKPNTVPTAWNDYVIIPFVEHEFGISILLRAHKHSQQKADENKDYLGAVKPGVTFCRRFLQDGMRYVLTGGAHKYILDLY